MSVLRDTLYTDRVMAVLREYGANAWDANREAGKKETPIKVTLPTFDSPTLKIRDSGRGLSQSDVFTVYTQYGASTKRKSDDAVGMLGIGCKSGFAYADSFTITSWHEGQQQIFVAALDVTNKGVINQLLSVPCEPSETGVEVQIAVKPEDVAEFQVKATQLFQHFTPQPEINEIKFPERPETRLKHGRVDTSLGYDGPMWVAVMGCVPYRINLAQLGDLALGLNQCGGELYFAIGAVTVGANREELKYTAETKAALVQKFADLTDEHIAVELAAINGTAKTPWERRLRAQKLRVLLPRITSTPVGTHGEEAGKGEDISNVMASAISLKHVLPLPAFTKVSVVRGDGNSAKYITVDSTTRIILRDNAGRKSLKGFRLGAYSYLFEGPSALLEDFCAALNITGVPTAKLSELPWTSSSNRKAGKRTEQHRKSCFVWTGGGTGAASTNWDPVEREPEGSDVVAILDCFEVIGCEGFNSRRRGDQALAKKYGLPFPEIYGYKTTSKKPLGYPDIKGTPYREWSEAFRKNLLTPEITVMAEHAAWCTHFRQVAHVYSESYSAKDWKRAIDTLGEKHPVVELLKPSSLERPDEPVLGALFALIDTAHIERDFDNESRPLLKRYPLLQSWNHLWGRDSAHWLEYIQLKDTQCLIPTP